MYSSTVSTATTIPIDKNWCRSVTTDDISTHKSDYYYPKSQFDDTLLRKLTKPIPFEDVPAEVKIYECTPTDKEKLKQKEEYLKKWLKEEHFNKKCKNLNIERLHLREQSAEKTKYTKKFLEYAKPWYISEKRPNTKNWPFLYYCFPKICVQLNYNFTDFRKIIEYYENGIYVFHVDLRYGSWSHIRNIFKEIEHARSVLDNKRNKETIISVGLEINSRRLRTGLVKKSQDVFLDKESEVILTAVRKYSYRCTNRVIYVNFADYIKNLYPDDIIKIGGQIQVKVEKVFDESVQCKVMQEGLLISKMPIEIPIERAFGQIDITKEEEEDVAFAINIKSDFLICPCPYKPKLIHYIRWMMAAQKRRVITFAKLNMTLDLLRKDINIVLSEYAGVWLTDNNCRSPVLFRYLINKCTWLYKPIIRVLNIKSENTPIANNQEEIRNLFLYPDCIAVAHSGSVNPIKVKSIIQKIYPEMNDETLLFYNKDFLRSRKSIEYLLIRYVVSNLLSNQASCIIICNNNGKSVSILSQHRPLIPIIASLCDIPTARSLTILKNVISLTFYDPIQSSWEQELTERVDCCLDYGKKMGYIVDGRPFLLVYDSRRGMTFSDTYRVLYLE